MEENKQKKQKKKLFNDIFFIIALTIIFMLALWMVDIGVSGMNMQLNASENEAFVIKGFLWERSPINQYHFGLIMAIVSFSLICALYLYQILKKA